MTQRYSPTGSAISDSFYGGKAPKIPTPEPEKKPEPEDDESLMQKIKRFIEFNFGGKTSETQLQEAIDKKKPPQQ